MPCEHLGGTVQECCMFMPIVFSQGSKTRPFSIDLGEVHDSSKALMVKKPRSIAGFYLPASRLIPDGVRLFKIDEFALYLMHMHFILLQGARPCSAEAHEADAVGRVVAAGPLVRMAEFQRVECTGNWPGSKSTASQNRLIVSKKNQNRLMPCQ